MPNKDKNTDPNKDKPDKILTDNVPGENSALLADATNREQTKTIDLPDVSDSQEDVTLPKLDFADDLLDLQGDNTGLLPINAA